VTRTLNTLNGAERRNANLYGVAGVSLGEHLQEVAHGGCDLRSRYANSVGYSTGGDLLANSDNGRTTLVGTDAWRCHVSSLPECAEILGFDTSLRDYSTSGAGRGRVRAHALGLTP